MMRKLILALGLSLALMSVASAGTIVQNALTGATVLPWAGALNFNLFDSNLGTLTKVELDITSELLLDVTAQAFDTGGTASGAGTALVSVVPPGPVPNVIVGPVNVNISVPVAPGSTVNAQGLGVAFAQFMSTSAPVLAAFQTPGGGALAILASALGSALYGADYFPNNVFGTTDHKVFGTLTYHYSDVPEPSTYMMMGAGIGLLALARYRRNR